MTYAGRPELTADDALGAEALRARGAAVEALPWDAAGVRWDGYDAVVVRSTWDYHRRPDDFRRWLEAMEGLRVRIWNPVSLLRWNMDKRYLFDLPAQLPVVRGELIEPGAGTTLAAVLERRRWRWAVVKPAISASGEDTWRTDVDSVVADEERFRALAARGAVLVQPFVEQVVTGGEWSLVYFRGGFSHAILKRPRAGEFRVQSQHGGRSEPGRPPPALLSQAERVLAEVRHPWLYARVDGCVVDGAFLLMELEMLEPALELWADGAAPRRFADAMLALL